MRAAAFYSDQPPDRIIGVECEYTIQNKVDGDEHPIADYIGVQALEAANLRWANANNSFISNGGKLHVDNRSIEYSAPESLGPQAALATDTAGRLVVAEVVAKSKIPHHGLYRTTGTCLRVSTGNAQDYREKSTGYHENYLIPRSLEEFVVGNDVMATFLATRLWSMGGMIRQGKFVYSQKMWGVGTSVIKGYGDRLKHGNKPMATIPTKAYDDDTLDNHQWARLEVRCGDATQSPTSRFLSFGATSLVLRMLEHQDMFGDRLTNIAFAKPVDAAHGIAGDLSNSRKYTTVEGKEMSALDVQEAFLELAFELSDKIELPKDELAALSLWSDACTLLRKYEFSPDNIGDVLPRRLEAAARFAYLHKKSRDEGCDFSSSRIAKLNLEWDCVLPKGGSTQWWDIIGSDLVSNDEVERLVHEPPTNTRAAVRAHYISERGHEITGISWHTVRLDWHTRSLHDPYVSS